MSFFCSQAKLNSQIISTYCIFYVYYWCIYMGHLNLLILKRGDDLKYDHTFGVSNTAVSEYL